MVSLSRIFRRGEASGTEADSVPTNAAAPANVSDATADASSGAVSASAAGPAEASDVLMLAREFLGNLPRRYVSLSCGGARHP